MLPYPLVWGKQNGLDVRYPLSLHLRDSAAVALGLWDLWLRKGLTDLISDSLGPKAREVLAYVVGSHDVGKANSFFAGQYGANSKGNEWMLVVRDELTKSGLSVETRSARPGVLRRHEQASAFFIDRDIADSNNSASRHWQALSVLGHHGVLEFDLRSTRYQPEDLHAGKWGELRALFLLDLQEGLGLSESDLPARVDPVVIVLIAGLTILADRLASRNESVTNSQARVKRGLLDPNDPAAWMARQYDFFVEVIKSQLGVYSPINDPTETILAGNPPRPLQEQALAVKDGIWFAMAATGSGKTEAALLRHSELPERLLFLLPTQATTNAMMNRVRRAYEGTPNIASLAHGLASVNDFYRVPVESGSDGASTNGLFPSEFLKHGGARLLAPVSVATVDQAIMGSLPLKWTPLRLLALANAHVVIDEAHTLDAYQTRLTEGLLWWLGQTNTRVSVLTATLPTWQRDVFVNAYLGGSSEPGEAVQFPSSEIATSSTRTVTATEMAQYQVEFQTEVSCGNIYEDHLGWARSRGEASPKARIGIIVNQIDRAQKIAKGLEDDGADVLCLHSRMTAAHRRRVEEELFHRLGPRGAAEGLYVVGTQVLEASLDIDFDLLSSDVAPSPALVQRAGRVWRHPDPQRDRRLPGVDHPVVRVVRGQKPGVDALPYLQSEADRAWDYLVAHGVLTIPYDLQSFIEAGVLNLESTLEQMNDSDLDELVQISRMRREAMRAGTNLSRILAPSATVGEFCTLTSAASRSAKESDGDFPTTRLIDDETRPIVIMGNPDVIPGAWSGSLDELRSVNGRDRLLADKALGATMSLSRKYLSAALNSGEDLLMDRGPLRGMLAIEMGTGFQYDSLTGLSLVQ